MPIYYFCFVSDMGGGAMYDIGIYAVQLATMVLGPNPSIVQGIGSLTESGWEIVNWLQLQLILVYFPMSSKGKSRIKGQGLKD